MYKVKIQALDDSNSQVSEWNFQTILRTQKRSQENYIY
jgi:hypothetical protein